MASFDINPKTHKAANKQAKINNMKKSDNPNERKVADKKLTPSARVDVPKFKKGQQEEVVPGLSLVDVILGEEKCGKGMYYCYTDKKCKKIPEGLKMTARFGGGGREPEEVGIDKPVEGGDGNGGNGGNGGGTSESLSIEDAFGNKFMEVVDLIKPEDITEKCWKGYKKKGMKTMFGKRYPNCVKANEENKLTDDALEKAAAATLKRHKEQGYKVHSTDSMKDVQDRIKKRSQKEEVNVDEAVRLQAEYGNLLAVVVIWRGRSLMIKMFFPQATMPKREDVQREVQKVYPGCKVTQFRRTELPSETSPHNDPILRVQKEEAECAGTSKGKDCPVHGQKCCPNLSEEEVEFAGELMTEEQFDEAAGEKDACYHKVKARYSVWPSAYASGALVKCRKKGAKNWGNKTKKESFELSDWRSDLEDDRLGKPELDEATPRPKATQRGKISKSEAQRRQARADRKAAAQERRDDKAKAGIDALIGSDAERKATAAARANPQGQRQKALKRTIADRMAKGAKDNKLGEKLNLKKADMGEVIDDFYDSDAPQFKGKSKEKRRQMAIAAKLQADEERACWKTHKKVGMKMKGGKLVNDCRPKNEEVAVDENRFASHGGKDSDAGSAYAKPSKGGNKKGVYTLKGKDGKPLFDKNEAVDLKKKSSERKLNTNPGEKPESAKEYRKNSEPLRKHREKFGDLAKEEKEGDHEFEMARRQLSTMKNAAKKLEKKMGKKGEGNLKAWVQSKITKAADYADTAADYVTKEDWQSVNRKDKTDGLSQKAVNAYRKENPGSKLKTAVTKKPSELKKGSKDAKRRSSFCSRMKGMKKRLTSAKTARDPDSRINKALRRWNCN